MRCHVGVGAPANLKQMGVVGHHGSIGATDYYTSVATWVVLQWTEPPAYRLVAIAADSRWSEASKESVTCLAEELVWTRKIHCKLYYKRRSPMSAEVGLRGRGMSDISLQQLWEC